MNSLTPQQQEYDEKQREHTFDVRIKNGGQFFAHSKELERKMLPSLNNVHFFVDAREINFHNLERKRRNDIEN